MLVEVRGRSARPALGRLRLGSSRLAWTAATIVAAVALFCGYLFQSRTQPVNSDASSGVLLGWEMLHGNPLLHGWLLADVSFWTFEAPVDGLIGLVTGLHADVAHITAALVYTLLVLTVALLAKGTATGREGITRALLAAGVLVAPAASVGARVLLLAPDHTGIGVPVLLTFLLIDRAPRRAWVPAAVCALLVWARLDDPVAGYAGAIPLALVCGVRALAGFSLMGLRRVRRGRRGQRPEPKASPGYDAVLAVAAVASYELTTFIVAAVRAAGGFQLRPIPGGTSIVPWSQVGKHLQWTGQNLLYLFGGNTWGQTWWLGILHWAGLAVAAAGLLAGIAWLVLPRRADRVTQTLTVGTLAMLAAGALSHLAAPVSGAHEIAIVLPFGAVLGGRTVGRWLGADHKARARRVTSAVLTPVLGVIGLGYLAQLGFNAALPERPAETQALGDWLAAHQLTNGLAGYWEANSTTVASGGLVHLAPVNNGGKTAYAWESKSAWYNPIVSNANFIVTTRFPPGAAGYAKPEAALHWYGQPDQVYQFQNYTILAYDYNLLTRVLAPEVPGITFTAGPWTPPPPRHTRGPAGPPPA